MERRRLSLNPARRKIVMLRSSSLSLVLPSLKDPRFTIAAALTLWTVLGQTAYYFNRDLLQIAVAIGAACLLDGLLTLILFRQLSPPLSAYITGLSIGILLESHDWRVFAVASTWGILSKYLLRDEKGHFFNPSNFAVVTALLLCHGEASVAPGSQWGADYRVAVVIIALGLMMMRRVKRLDLALAWLGGYVVMGLSRMALGQGGLVFALGPMTGAEFALFTFSMMPDPKTSPPTRNGRIAWGLSIALMDGVLRYLEIRYSMFFALFVHTAALPLLRRLAVRAGFVESDPWRVRRIPLRPSPAEAPSSSPPTALPCGPIS
jgi:Na+-translocating ferredoxin:NAD+ oxidoreductase RnfD subunit